MVRAETVRASTKHAISIVGVGILIATAFLLIGVGGCGGGDDEEGRGGDSGYDAPENFFGWTLALHIDSSSGTADQIVPEGSTVTFTFIDEHTVLGEGGVGNPGITSWSYTSSGSSATLKLNFAGLSGFSITDLSFTTETQGMHETYSEPSFGGVFARSSGRFTISRASSSGSSVLVWPLEDSCNDGFDMEVRFFDRTNGGVWPGSGEVYVLRGDDTYRLACTPGARVCYGARARNSPYTNYWGVGLDGDEGCDRCCYTCPTSGDAEVDGQIMICP